MSDAPDRHEKVHDPSAQRLRKAREDGNVFQSRDATAVVMLALSCWLLVKGMPYAFAVLKELMQRTFLAAGTTTFDARTVQTLLGEITWRGALVLMPIALVLTLGAALTGAAQTGAAVSSKLLFKPDRLSPAKGLKRLFSSQGAMEAGKATLKIAIVGPIVYGLFQSVLPDILTLHQRELAEMTTLAGKIIARLSYGIVFSLAGLALMDIGYSRWKWRTDLKMTHKEVRDEAKEQDGDPMVRSRRRQIARERARRPRLSQAVGSADVVVTNPTHYAVALRYAPAESAAPRLLVKGARLRALRIRELADAHGVPRLENPPLARALYAEVEEGAEIPEELYAAVAAVLAEVYRNRDRA